MLLCSMFLEKSAHIPEEFHNSLIQYAAPQYSYISFFCFNELYDFHIYTYSLYGIIAIQPGPAE